MTAKSVCLKIAPGRAAETLRAEGVEMAKIAGAELVLDFSDIVRIDAGTVAALEELAGIAGRQCVPLALRSVNIDVYRALRLLNHGQNFTFLS